MFNLDQESRFKIFYDFLIWILIFLQVSNNEWQDKWDKSAIGWHINDPVHLWVFKKKLENMFLIFIV